MNVFQRSLFPRNNEFDPKRFESFLSGNNLESVVSNSIAHAFEEVLQVSDKDNLDSLTKRVKSDMMNGMTFRNIISGLQETGLISENNITHNSSGNVKSGFTVSDYIFILHKEGASKNATSITDNIYNQSCDKDIIEIRYVIDNTWTKLIAIRFVYALGGNTIYSHDVPLNTTTGIYLANSIINEQVEPVKVHLKPGIKKHAQNG